ncbi:MAG: hypothetical protein FWE25_02885 [Lachnospiraceae bacterium]|nr:hypothetical protein [Lachnospiraceae bacterium]
MSPVTFTATQARQKVGSKYLRNGIIIATASGVTYGLYTAFITLAMSMGVWEDWYGPNLALLSLFTITYVLGSLGSAVNYTLSAVWATGAAAVKGKLRDFVRSIKTKPGRTLVIASLVGGPISTSAYVIGLQLAGSIIIPITALCPAIGAILARIFYKQKLTARMLFGIAICVLATVLIGLQAVEPDAHPNMLLGIIIASVAAFGWGFEGCIAGYATAFIDDDIAILIRQSVAGLSGLIILAPLFALIGGNVGEVVMLAGRIVTDMGSFPIFFISSFFALYTFKWWYKGNSMCGAALGMACNGTFSFWGPLFCWLILGLIVGQDGWALPPVAWVAAVLMFIGVLFIAVNPLMIFKKKEVA